MTASDPIEFTRDLGSKGQERCGNRVQIETGDEALIDNTNPLPVDDGWFPFLTALEGPNNNTKSETIPANRWAQVLWIWLEYTSDANVGDRQIIVEILDDENDLIAEFRAGSVQAASLTRNYMFAPSLADLTAFRDTDYLQTPLPPTLILDGSYTIRVRDNNNVSALDDMALQIMTARKVSL